MTELSQSSSNQYLAESSVYVAEAPASLPIYVTDSLLYLAEFPVNVIEASVYVTEAQLDCIYVVIGF